jgi:hypothetical protein
MAQSVGLGVKGLGLMAQSIGLGVKGLGFRVFTFWANAWSRVQGKNVKPTP